MSMLISNLTKTYSDNIGKIKALVNGLNRKQSIDSYVDINSSYLFIPPYAFCFLSSHLSELAHKSIRLEYCIHIILKTNLHPPPSLVLGFEENKHILSNRKFK